MNDEFINIREITLGLIPREPADTFLENRFPVLNITNGLAVFDFLIDLEKFLVNQYGNTSSARGKYGIALYHILLSAKEQLHIRPNDDTSIDKEFTQSFIFSTTSFSVMHAKFCDLLKKYKIHK